MTTTWQSAFKQHFSGVAGVSVEREGKGVIELKVNDAVLSDDDRRFFKNRLRVYGARIEDRDKGVEDRPHGVGLRVKGIFEPQAMGVRRVCTAMLEKIRPVEPSQTNPALEPAVIGA